MDKTKEQMAASILEEIEAPVNELNLKFMYAWMQKEGTSAKFNPLSSTLHMPGSTKFNENSGYPVQNYPDYETGVKAIAHTIRTGYSAITQGLRSGDPREAIFSGEFDKWAGTRNKSNAGEYAQFIGDKLGVGRKSGIVASTLQVNKTKSNNAVDSFFGQFGTLAPVLDKFKAIPDKNISKMSNFLLGIGKGKIVKF